MNIIQTENLELIVGKKTLRAWQSYELFKWISLT